MKTISKIDDQTTRRLLADGAWGTELMKRSSHRGDAPERLNLDDPQIVLEVASDYLAAGADIILTNSFGGSRPALERHGLADQVQAINRAAAEISRRAAGDRARVAGSIGPSGKLIMTGDIDRTTLYNAFREQAAALLEGGVELIVLESMSDIEEMVAAVEASRDAISGADIPIVSSMVYEPVLTGGYRTIMGNAPGECVKRVLEAGASIVGANCGIGIERYVELARELVDLDLAPVWIKPNRGIPEVVDGKTIYRQSAAEFATYAKVLLEAGVTIVGGCCGTTPGFITEVRKVVDEYNREHCA